jgi:hypothetical protein
MLRVKKYSSIKLLLLIWFNWRLSAHQHHMSSCGSPAAFRGQEIPSYRGGPVYLLCKVGDMEDEYFITPGAFAEESEHYARLTCG